MKHKSTYDLLKQVRGTIPAPPRRIFTDKSKYNRKTKHTKPYGHF